MKSHRLMLNVGSKNSINEITFYLLGNYRLFSRRHSGDSLHFLMQDHVWKPVSGRSGPTSSP
jgi:hypothetical protein